MDVVVVLIAYLLIPALLIGGLGAVGRVTEKRHLAELDAREAQLAHVVVTDLRTLPPGVTADAGALVGGNAVIASDYRKQFLIGMRNLVGGEVRSYRPVMDRARREARLRMLEEAAGLGSSLILNVRFTTTDVGRGATEVICYGTAVRTTR